MGFGAFSKEGMERLQTAKAARHVKCIAKCYLAFFATLAVNEVKTLPFETSPPEEEDEKFH